MEITWWGTAGFRISSGDSNFLIDPYLSRNPKARPASPLDKSQVGPHAHIFISHGHFDHLIDVPEVARRSGAVVHCDPVAAASLVRDGLDPDRIDQITSDGQIVEFDAIRAQAFYSRHVKFDRPLVFKTLGRVNFRLPLLLPLLMKYPPGQVLSWRFDLENKTLHHFGSGGSSPEELESLARNKTDILLVPLQGHSRICEIAINYVRILNPGLVICHHQDDFYPPISQMVDPGPFIGGVERLGLGTDVRILEVGESLRI